MEPNWKAILERLPDAVMVTDAQGVIQVWNKTMELLTGYSRHAVEGQHDAFLRCVPAADSNGHSAPVLHTEPEECTLHRRDGGLVPVLRNTRQLHDRAGQVTATVCVFTDLRSLKEPQAQVARLRPHAHRDAVEDRLIGKNQVMREVRDRIRLAADSNATVLILGETGTGKELVAEAIHFESERQNQPLVRVNCSALPETLSDLGKNALRAPEQAQV